VKLGFELAKILESKGTKNTIEFGLLEGGGANLSKK
jgi:hypothetical protein